MPNDGYIKRRSRKLGVSQVIGHLKLTLIPLNSWKINMNVVLSTLSVLLLLASYGYSTHVDPDTSDPKPLVIGDPSASTSNGSTLQDILQELSRSETNER